MKSAEPAAEPTLIARIRNWFRKNAGGTGIPIVAIDEETKQPVEVTLYKYNVDVNTGAGIFKLSQTATSEQDCRQLVINWYVNKKLLVKPDLIGPVKGSDKDNPVWRYKCAIQTGTGTLKREVEAVSAEKAIEECKVWFLRFKMKLVIKLVGPVRNNPNAESGKKQ